MENFLKENWFRVSIVVAILIIAISAGYYFIFSLEQQNNIALQSECAEQAGKAYKEEGYGSETSGGLTTSSYADHYNQSLNKCFIETFDNSNGSLNIFLIDAYELKEYAWYSSTPGVKGAEGFICNLDEQISDASVLAPDCNSRADFDKYVQRYMGN